MGDRGIRIVVLSPFPVVLAGLRYMLERHHGFDLVGECASITDAVALIKREQAQVVLIDPDSDEVPIGAVSAVSEACDSRILVLTGHKDIDATAIELGARGVVAKEEALNLIVRAIEKVHAGQMWLDRDKTAQVLLRAVRGLRDPEALKIQSLTNREREIVALVGEGLGNAAIGERLFISEATVRNHLTSILGKLGLINRFELAVYAFRHQLVLPKTPADNPAPGNGATRAPGTSRGMNGVAARAEVPFRSDGRRLAAVNGSETVTRDDD